MTDDRPTEHAPRERTMPADSPAGPVPPPLATSEPSQPAGAPPGPSSPRPARSRPAMPEYRGGELDPDRGPGLGCFWFQVIVLAVFLVLIPIGYNLNWPFEVLAVLLFIILGLLLFVGQTLIFLLRLVAADRRTTGRRRPLASASKTVGQLEDERRGAEAEAAGRAADVEQGSGDAGAADDRRSLEAAGDDSDGRGDAQPGPGGMRE